jgi:hypothetical protein
MLRLHQLATVCAWMPRRDAGVVALIPSVDLSTQVKIYEYTRPVRTKDNILYPDFNHKKVLFTVGLLQFQYRHSWKFLCPLLALKDIL